MTTVVSEPASLTTKDLCRIFRREPMTIYNWRRNEGLPYVEVGEGDKPRIRFVWSQVRDWAIKNNKSFVEPSL